MANNAEVFRARMVTYNKNGWHGRKKAHTQVVAISKARRATAGTGTNDFRDGCRKDWSVPPLVHGLCNGPPTSCSAM